jgi:hypothetical protein
LLEATPREKKIFAKQFVFSTARSPFYGKTGKGKYMTRTAQVTIRYLGGAFARKKDPPVNGRWSGNPNE